MPIAWMRGHWTETPHSLTLTDNGEAVQRAVQRARSMVVAKARPMPPKRSGSIAPPPKRNHRKSYGAWAAARPGCKRESQQSDSATCGPIRGRRVRLGAFWRVACDGLTIEASTASCAVLQSGCHCTRLGCAAGAWVQRQGRCKPKEHKTEQCESGVASSSDVRKIVNAMAECSRALREHEDRPELWRHGYGSPAKQQKNPVVGRARCSECTSSSQAHWGSGSSGSARNKAPSPSTRRSSSATTNSCEPERRAVPDPNSQTPGRAAETHSSHGVNSAFVTDMMPTKYGSQHPR